MQSYSALLELFIRKRFNFPAYQQAGGPESQPHKDGRPSITLKTWTSKRKRDTWECCYKLYRACALPRIKRAGRVGINWRNRAIRHTMAQRQVHGTWGEFGSANHQVPTLQKIICTVEPERHYLAVLFPISPSLLIYCPFTPLSLPPINQPCLIIWQ